MIVRTALGLVGLYARLSRPFIPFAAEKIAASVGEGGPLEVWPDAAAVVAALKGPPPGAALSTPDVLFRKVEDTQIAEWGEQFGGA